METSFYVMVFGCLLIIAKIKNEEQWANFKSK